MRLLIAVLIGVSTTVSFAEDLISSRCTPILVSDETAKLSASTPSLVLIHNVSKNDLWITHPVSDPSASAGWSSRLQAGNWSALALTDKSFELSCIESKPGHEQQVPCSGVVAICEFSNVKMPENVKAGTYWAGEDSSLKALTSYIGQRGFVMPEAE